MKPWILPSFILVALSSSAGDARADFEMPGVYGVPASPSDAGCWQTSGAGAYATKMNTCGTSPWEYRQIYFPLLYQSTWGSNWHAQIRASAGVACAVFATSEDGSGAPVGSGYGWSSGPSTPIDVVTPPTWNSAGYVYCWVPTNGWVNTVRWWIT